MKRIGIILLIGVIVVFGFLFVYRMNRVDVYDIYLDDVVNWSLDEVFEYADKIGLELEVEYQYSKDIEEGLVISQDVGKGEVVYRGDKLGVVVSKGRVPVSLYREYGVNEVGKVPIMMYHGIVDMASADTGYVGGNVDRDGYNRTVEAFRGDLEFYYTSGYRMIRLDDYVSGIVDVELGKSPIILTFDDGNENNFRVLGEENGNLVIDPNCAVGVLEEFKKKYPDYGVTATFFVNGGKFGQGRYDDKILKWLVDHGYDVGNHTMNHVDFTKVSYDRSVEEVGGVYQMLEGVIPGRYVNIVALPFGSPYKSSHNNYKAILEGEFGGVSYKTKATLRVGWEADSSCFDVSFESTFLKRIRAYDNDGKDFDIEMNFRLLEKNRYVSDGYVDTVVVESFNEDRVVSFGKEVILY